MATIDVLPAQDDTLQGIKTHLQTIANALDSTDYVKTINGIGVQSGTHNVVLPNAFTPQIYVVAPTGSTVTITKGSTVLTPTESSGTWTVSIPEWGDWVVVVQKVISSSFTLTHTETISVEEVKRYTVRSQWIYGVIWSGNDESVCVRTNDAANFADPNPYYSGMTSSASSPFDDCYPWSKMEDVEVGDDDYSYVENYGELVRIPKYYYKWAKTGTVMSLQICPYQPDSTWHCSPAHMARDGHAERDVVYIGKYHSSNQNFKSVASDTPMVNQTRAQFRTSIHSLGSDCWMLDYAMMWTYNMLYLVEFADWDVQAKIGYGRGNGSSVQACNAGGTFSYHTGTPYTSRTTYGVSCKYRNVVGMWDNCAMWCDGVSFNDTSVYASVTNSSYSDDYTATGYSLIGTRPTSSGGDIKSYFIPSATGFEWALFCESTNGTSNAGYHYVKDGYWYAWSSSNPSVLSVGGDYGQSLNYSLFLLGSNLGSSATASAFGSRLQILP